MKTIAFVFALGTLAFGCGGNAADEAMSRMQTAKNKICACKDLPCAEKAKDEFRDWTRANKDKLKDKPSDSFLEKFNKLEDEADACKDKLEEAAAPKAADPVPVPPPPAADPVPPPAADPAAAPPTPAPTTP